MLEFLVVSITFYLLGRYAGRESEILTKGAQMVKKRLTRVPAGPIDYPTPQEIAYHGSEQEKIDQAMTEAATKAGLL